MKSRRRAIHHRIITLFAVAALSWACGLQGGPSAPTAAADPLPSWIEGPAKAAIVDFVERVTDPASPDFVAAAERVAVFDNDGTLWSEQPMYFQLTFAIDRVGELAVDHPEWADTMPFKAVLDGDFDALVATGEHGFVELVMATHAGMTVDEFSLAVEQWLETARHPRFDRPYTDLVYQPMLEVLSYLRANGFKTFIVSGGGIDFMRVFTERVYGIGPEQVVGSMGDLSYELRDGVPVLIKQPGISFVDDKDGKPVGIQRFIGRRPLAAFGNSDGDFEMLDWTTSADGPSFGLYVHHDDADREWAYDRDSAIGRLDRGLDEAADRGWMVVSMKNDWQRVYPWEEITD